MTQKKLLYLRHIQTSNRGFWLAEKIYSDVTGNRCKCGGPFTEIRSIKKIEYPTCASCGEPPHLFRIRAKVSDTVGVERYIDIRHAQDGSRLKDIIDVLSTLKQISNEIEQGIFDLRKYDSIASREAFLFENYSKAYLEFNGNRLARGEISPSGFRNKEKYVRRLLLHFQGVDIGLINHAMIEDFRNSFIATPRTRDLAHGELMTILNHAHRRGDIQKVPKVAPVPQSRKRKEIITLDVALRVIEAVEDPQYKAMIRLLSIYPVRPGELKALKWRDVDLIKERVTFASHLSDDVLIEGRKSVGSGEKSSLDFPLVKELRDYLRDQPTPISRDTFIFKGKIGPFVTGNCLAKAWRKATRALKLPDHQLYELRHARLTQIGEQSNGDIVKMMKVSGHTNPRTLMERYVRGTSDLSEFFN